MRWIDKLIARFRRRAPAGAPLPPPRPEPSPTTGMDEKTARRARLAIDSLLDNESLTSDLEDDPARMLVDMGADWMRRLAQSTAALDDQEAEQRLSGSFDAARQTLRSISEWAVSSSSDSSLSQTILDQTLRLLPGVTISPQQRQMLLDQLNQAATPVEKIAALRNLLKEKFG